MAGEQANAQVVNGAFAAFLRGDLGAVLAASNPDIEVEFFGPSTLPMAGHFKGHAGLQDYLARVLGAVEFLEFSPQEYICEGNSVVVLGFTQARARSNGREGRLRWAVVFTIKDGKIARYRVHEDTGTLAQLLAAP